MSSKTFITISKKECLTVYKNILEHSEQKWESGKQLAKINDFGGATSLAIISVEELVKSLIIFLDGKGFEFRSIKGINTLFENHKIRYLLAYAMFSMGIFGDELMKFLKKTRENPQEILNLIEEKKNNIVSFEKKIKFYALKKIVLLKREFEWFAKVDIFRQDGFYCDYVEQLKNPITISPIDYEQVIVRLEKVRTVGKGIIEAFDTTDEISNEQFAQIKRDFKQKKYYEKFSKALATVRQTRENPFDLIKKNISDSFPSLALVYNECLSH